MLTIYKRLTSSWMGWGALGVLALVAVSGIASVIHGPLVVMVLLLAWVVTGAALPPMRGEVLRLRTRALRELTGDARRAHAAFANAGSALSDETGLTVVEYQSFVDADGRTRTREIRHRTRLTCFRAVASGVAFTAAPPTACGLTAEDVVAAQVRLEAWWAARLGSTATVTVTRDSAAVATVTVRLSDPLTEERSAPARAHWSDQRFDGEVPMPAGERRELLGYNEDAAEVLIDLHNWHTLVVGTTGSGKSASLYYPLALLAGSDEFVVVGVDPSGILLRPWASMDPSPAWFSLGTANLPHAVSVLENTVKLMDRRIEWIANQGRDKMVTSDGFPTIVVVLEEFHALLAASEVADLSNRVPERVRPRILAAVGRLLRESRKANMIVVCAIQRPDAVLIGGGDRAQYARRISFRMDNADSVRMVMESATPDEVDQMISAQPGQGFISEPGERLRRFRSVSFPYADYLTHVYKYGRAASSRLDFERTEGGH